MLQWLPSTHLLISFTPLMATGTLERHIASSTTSSPSPLCLLASIPCLPLLLTGKGIESSVHQKSLQFDSVCINCVWRANKAHTLHCMFCAFESCSSRCAWEITFLFKNVKDKPLNRDAGMPSSYYIKLSRDSNKGDVCIFQVWSWISIYSQLMRVYLSLLYLCMCM